MRPPQSSRLRTSLFHLERSDCASSTARGARSLRERKPIGDRVADAYLEPRGCSQKNLRRYDAPQRGSSICLVRVAILHQPLMLRRNISNSWPNRCETLLVECLERTGFVIMK